MPTRSGQKYFGRRWCGLKWSPWVQFLDFDSATLPAGPGLYRVRARGKPYLAYIGETGVSLRARLATLRNEALKSKMPFNDPHTAAPNLWAWSKSDGLQFECSAAGVNLSRNARRGLENYLLWRYRIERGESPLCNLGRFHPEYKKSSGRNGGTRGRRLLPRQKNRAGGKSAPPLTYSIRKPSRKDWMGLYWVELPLNTSAAQTAPNRPGLYKVQDSRTGEVLYVGQTSSLRGRLSNYLRGNWRRKNVSVWFSTISAFETLRKHNLLELESDLLGAFYGLYRKTPRLQFSKKP